MSIAKTREISSSEQAEEALQALRAAAKARKAMALERAGTAAGEAELVRARITKFGDGLVSSGEHVAGSGDLCFDADEAPMLPRAVAEALERKGLVEFDREQEAPLKLSGGAGAADSIA
jgi:hypothetical protein